MSSLISSDEMKAHVRSFATRVYSEMTGRDSWEDVKAEFVPMPASTINLFCTCVLDRMFFNGTIQDMLMAEHLKVSMEELATRIGGDRRRRFSDLANEKVILFSVIRSVITEK